MACRDTIVAVATPPGRGGIAVLRISGQRAFAVGEEIAGAAAVAGGVRVASFKDGDGSTIDRGIAICFRAPRSYTGEDVLELHGHGSPMAMNRLLDRACSLGARLARPGEFTERAFLNDKIDLAQAEAVADLIDSSTRQAARSAMRSLAGEFSQRVLGIDRLAMDLRVHVEAAIDFADEEIDFLADSDIAASVDTIKRELADVTEQSRRGQVLRDGLDVVIAGPPNVGKSSLLNRLLAEDRAIVTEVPGTTRDLLSADIEIAGVAVRLTDTAGLRPSADRVEAIGVERARGAAEQADLVLMVEDANLPRPENNTVGELEVPVERRLRVRNKVDLSGATPGRSGSNEVRVSALTGAGIDALCEAIATMAGVGAGEGAYLARKRHLDALAAAAVHIAEAGRRLAEGFGDLAAEELRHAHGCLGDIVGATSSDDLLGEIFRSFCIGK